MTETEFKEMPPLHPYNELFRWMTDDEMEELVESIKYHKGLLVPIVVDRNGVLLDGKCRFRACQIAGIEPSFKTFEGVDDAFPGARLPYEEQCEQLIVALNVHRDHYNPSQRAIAAALLAYPGCYWEHRVLPEARAVAEHTDLAHRVRDGFLSLPEAYEQVLQRQEEAKQRAEYLKRLEEFRKDQPLLAMQVDDGELTLDRALAVAGEQAAAPLLAEHAEAIRFLGRRVITDIIEIGRRLTECKVLLGHGNWLPWLEREFGWGGETTALNFMRVFRMFGANPQQVADLELPANVGRQQVIAISVLGLIWINLGNVLFRYEVHECGVLDRVRHEKLSRVAYPRLIRGG